MPRAESSFVRSLLVALPACVLACAGCGSDPAAATADGTATHDAAEAGAPADVGAETGGLDAAGADLTGSDTGAAEDTTGDAPSTDTLSADLGSPDTDSPDTGSGDTGSNDEFINDTLDAGPDGSGEDVFPADAGAAEVVTADIGSASGCDAEHPCTLPGESCLPPGAFGGCGMCNSEPGCASDAECGGLKNGICSFEASDCTCSGEKNCHVGCGSDPECGTGEVCQGKHCVEKPCLKGSDCPALFACFMATKTCGRKNCGKSSECGDGGTCVSGKCHAAPGTCTLPKA